MRPRINLLPGELQRAPRDKTRTGLIGVGLMLLLGLAGAWGYFITIITYGTDRIKAIDQELAQLQPLLDKQVKMEGEILACRKQTAMVVAVKKERVLWSRLLLEINKTVPMDVTIIEIKEAGAGKPGGENDKDKDKDKVSAADPKRPSLLISGASSSFVSIGVMLLQLRELPYFREVGIKWAKERDWQGQPLYLFELFCHLQEVGGEPE